MEINAFINLCAIHNFKFRTTTGQEYLLGKITEREIFAGIQANPAWYDIYLDYAENRLQKSA